MGSPAKVGGDLCSQVILNLHAVIFHFSCCLSFIYFHRVKVAKRPARGRNSHSLLLLVNCLVDNITRPSLVRRSNPIYRLQGAAELAPCDYMMKFILALRSNSLAQWPASGRDLHCVAYGAGFSLKLPLLYPIAKVIPRLRRKVTRKRAKAKLV